LAKDIVVVAIGGNAINREGEIGTVKEEFRNIRKALNGVIHVLKSGYSVVLTHGNGPQAGKFLLRVEAGMEKQLPDRPLGVIVADTQGGIGYMIEQSLQNRVKLEQLDQHVVTVLTQVLVDPNDPSILSPSKPVGSFYTEAEAKTLMAEREWLMVEDANRGWRRVVPSPKPLKIIEDAAIQTLINAGFLVIACGGGGIPVFENEEGMLEGIDCIIDKDYASAKLASSIGADSLLIATGVEKVSINFGKPNQQELDQITLSECRRYIAEGQFPKGSMLPKIEAAMSFIANGGRRAIITLPETLNEALAGETGTVIVND
jgi:carbamate kinase